MNLTQHKAKIVRQDWQDGQLAFDRLEVKSLLAEIDRLQEQKKADDKAYIFSNSLTAR
jgi:hypothetical protein